MHQLLKLILLLSIPLPVFAQQADSKFQVYEDETVIQLPDSVQAKVQSNNENVREILKEWLYADGFLNAEIEQIQPAKASIERNCAYQFSELKLRYADDPDSTIKVEINDSYTQSILKHQINLLLLNAANDGFPYAEADISAFSPDSSQCSVVVEIEIDKGKQAKASQIYFVGNKVNTQQYLQRVSRFQPNQIITPAYLKSLRDNLNASELFNSVGEAQILNRKEEVLIVFNVQERSMNLFDGLLGYVPDATGNGQIVGDLRLSLWNVISQGSGLQFEYQRLRPETSELNLMVSQDWIGNIPIGLSAGFQIYQNDTTYQSRQVGLNGYYRISPGFKINGVINYEATTSGGDNLTTIEPNGRKRTAKLGFEYSTLNSYEVPTSGTYVSLMYGISNKNLESDSSGSFIQNSLELSAGQFLPLLERSVIALSLHGFLLEADKVTLNDLIRFSGANSLRGYAEEQFRAGRMVWGDAEYRFLLDSNSYLFVFGAAGGYQRPKLLTEVDNTFQVTDYLFSTGFGLSYQTRIGRLKFTYAISPEESIGNGKVHFGITTQF